jgi:hypothetical protein
VAATPVRAEGCAGGSSGPRMAVAVAVGVAGGGVGRVSVLQAAAAPVDADKGGAGGSSGPQVGTALVVREAGSGAVRGSGPQDVAFPSPTSIVPVASGGGGSNQTTGCGDGVQGSGDGTEVPVVAVGDGSNGGSVTTDLMPAIISSL